METSSTPSTSSWDPASSAANDSNSTKQQNDPSPPGKEPKDKVPTEGLFECNICLEPPSDPVVSFCGHLFCWPCLHGWLEMRPEGTQTCPVCIAAIDREKVIPLYGRNSKGEDPRKKAVPPRPQAHRTEQTRTGHYQNPMADFPPFGFPNNAGGFHMTLGFGAFPFTLMANMFNANGNAPPGQIEQGLVSKIFLWVAILMIFGLIFL